jgi:prepilin-type N-terminal cleavage/methylation domain-containing protein
MFTTRSNTGLLTCRARPRGFTLVELMVSVTIMGVLVAMSATRFGRSLEQSKADFAAANLRAVWAAQRLYWLENHVYCDQITRVGGPKALYELGLLDPAIVSTTGDYAYAITAADADSFQATATRTTGAGMFTINQSGDVTGFVSGDITPGFH